MKATIIACSIILFLGGVLGSSAVWVYISNNPGNTVGLWILVVFVSTLIAIGIGVGFVIAQRHYGIKYMIQMGKKVKARSFGPAGFHKVGKS